MTTITDYRSTQSSAQNHDYLAGGEAAIGMVWLAFYGVVLIGALVSPILARSIEIAALY